MIRRVLIKMRLWTGERTEPFEGYVCEDLPIHQDETDGSLCVFGLIKETFDDIFAALLKERIWLKLRQSNSGAPMLEDAEAVVTWLNSASSVNISAAHIVAWSIVNGCDQFIRQPDDTDEFVAAVENERKS